MQRFAGAIDALNVRIGHAVAWCALGLVLAEVTVVVLRYVFGIGLIALQEAAIYQHGFLITLGAGFAMVSDDHVRVDILYGRWSPRARALVDLVGTLVLLLPFCAVIWSYAYPYVAQSWKIMEGSRESSGLPILFVLKTGLLVFAALLAIQGVAVAFRSMAAIMDRRKA